MKQYLLSMYQPQGPIPGPEVLGPVMEKLGAIRAELASQGQWVFGNGLHAPETATVLRPKDVQCLEDHQGKRSLQDVRLFLHR